MKRIKNRKKHFRISNPLGFSLFCAMIILVVGLVVGAVFLAKGGYFKQMFNSVKSEVSGNRATPTQEAEATEPPTVTDAPSMPPTEEAAETPEIGTPEPETPTPPPIEPETPQPGTSKEPETSQNISFEGFTIGIDPTRDGGSKYKTEGEYNLSLAKELAEYLESKGAKVVITREDNKKEVGNSKRAKIIKEAKCNVAIRLMCNEVGSSVHGFFVQGTKKNESFARIVIKAYADGTGMDIQSSKGRGFDKVDDEVASKCGCPCVRIVLGNWKNKADREDLEDPAFREKMIRAIAEALYEQLKQ
jgi:N-acetylmuramoyl-L-alanine amidase